MKNNPVAEVVWAAGIEGSIIEIKQIIDEDYEPLPVGTKLYLKGDDESRLSKIVMAHTVDLQNCIPVLIKYGMKSTAKEIQVAIKELRKAAKK